MEKSSSIKNIASALIKFHIKVDVIKKDAENPFYKNSYASLPHILSCIDVPLLESGLTYSQFPTAQNGLTTILMHAESGEYMQAEYTMTPAQNTPQGIGSSITYQRRYALAAILGLNIDEDDDGNEGSRQPKQADKKTQPQNDLSWLNENTKEFDGAVTKMRAGKSNIEALRKYFKISKATEAKLLEAANK